MRLTKNALNQINNSRTRMRIALALGCSDMTVRRYIDSNDDNLTKAASLAVIKEDTHLNDSEILEEDEALRQDVGEETPAR